MQDYYEIKILSDISFNYDVLIFQYMCKYSVDMYVDLYRLTQKVEPIDDLLFFFSK